MLAAVAIGLVAAVLSVIPSLLQGSFPGFDWYSPVFVLGIASLGMVLQRFVLDRRPGARTYDGLADLFIHIHAPVASDAPMRWTVRGVISFFLALFGAGAGPEGAAAEITHALSARMRARSARWFEQRRRSDAASALSAAISASFAAPFAGVLVPIELGIGGRTITSVLASLVAFLGMRSLVATLGVGGFAVGAGTFDLGGALYGFRFVSWQAWAGVIAVALFAGAFGALVTRFCRYSQESLLDLFQTQAWMRTLAGGILLFLVALVYRKGHAPPAALLEQVLWSRRTPSEVALLLCTGLLGLSVLLSGFGTIGVFWPLFALGGFVGYEVNHFVLHDLAGFSAVAGLAGGVAVWAAVLGTPISAAVLAFELTQNVHVLLPCLLAGLIAREVARLLRTSSIVELDLRARGMSLVDGRSAEVLQAVAVRDAMVTDHETVHEHEPVAGLYNRLLKSRYPFLPVVNTQGVYTGLLTIDMVQDAWQAQAAAGTSNSPLSKLLEAKDLLYRASLKVPSVRVSDRLSSTRRLFDDFPCVPVLGEDGRVQGLLFVYSVRVAYDREVARRSLTRLLDQ